jgi:hypothetical protein
MNLEQMAELEFQKLSMFSPSALEKRAAAAFFDEMKKIVDGLAPGDREKVASVSTAPGQAMFTVPSEEDIRQIIKEAGFFDRMKSFTGGGMQNGIPMHSLGSQLAQSNPFTGMGSSLAGAAGAVGGKLQGAAGAVGNFLRGGQQNGIPMHSLGGQLAESNPMTGMASSLKQNVGGLASSVAQKARQMWGGGGGAPAVGGQPAPAAGGGGNPAADIAKAWPQKMLSAPLSPSGRLQAPGAMPIPSNLSGRGPQQPGRPSGQIMGGLRGMSPAAA